MKMVALIPARAGSKRIPGKNTKLLAGHPLIAYTIAAALDAEVFDRVVLSSDDLDAQRVGVSFKIRVNHRPAEYATDDAPDIAWVRKEIAENPNWEAFAILRPTSPFRTAETIWRAYDQFRRSEVHSIRAVEPVKQNPYKMWHVQESGCMDPVLGGTYDGTPYHSCPSQLAPKTYIQNASLEMAWSYVVNSFGTISGRKIAPFFTKGFEGVDLNDEEDWARAEALIASGAARLPEISRQVLVESPQD